MSFIDTATIAVTERKPGWRGRAFDSPSMTFVQYEFEAGASIHEHHHGQEEVWQILEGDLEISIGGETRKAGPGFVGIVPPDTPHSVRAITCGRAIVTDFPRAGRDAAKLLRDRSLKNERADCERMDAEDPLAHARERFLIPHSLIYLDGNSLGALPAATPPRLAQVIEKEWGENLIGSWNVHDWIGLPQRIDGRIARLIGAEDSEVIAADSTSVNFFKLAAAALRLKAPRRVIVAERGNFPTDLYVLQGLEDLLGGAIELRLVAPEEISGALDDTVALLALTHVHYKTGALHDMQALTQAAHAAGSLALWDLSHSAGAVELFLDRHEADLAVGCGYKYLNGGPGAPAFLYVASRHQQYLRQPLSGWMGHATPFEFGDDYRPADGMARTLCGTPAVLAMATLAEGIATFDGVAMRDVRTKSRALGDLFLALVDSRCGGAAFAIACPRDSAARGSQVALRHDKGHAIIQSLIAQGVIGDFRAPDILRFGFAPLYTRYVDVWDSVDRLAAIMREESWRDERFRKRAAVT